MQTTFQHEDAQQRPGSAELEDTVGKLLDGSFELIEEDHPEESGLEAGCLSCS